MYEIDKFLANLTVFIMIPDAEQQSMKYCCGYTSTS